MCEHKLKTMANSKEFVELFTRIVDRTLDGIVLVGYEADKFEILLVNPTIVHDFAASSGGEIAGKDYFDVMFGLNLKQSKEKEKAEKLPLYKVLVKREKVATEPPYPTIAARNKLAYQVETRVASIPINGSEKQIAFEFWRRMGNPQVFQKDPSFINI